MPALKATILDDDAFRLLAIPFGGPIPSPYSPLGVDLDGEWFDHDTDLALERLKARPVDWHHRHDGVMKAEVIGKAVDPVEEEDGVWVTVWLDHGARRLNLVKRLAEAGAQLFGSSEADPTGVRKAATGHIDAWPYIKQALTTSPQNTLSVTRPLKAAIGAPLPHESLQALAADLRHSLPSEAGDDAALRRRLMDDLSLIEKAGYRIKNP